MLRTEGVIAPESVLPLFYGQIFLFYRANFSVCVKITYCTWLSCAAIAGFVYINTDTFENNNSPHHLSVAPPTLRWLVSHPTLQRT